MNDSAQSWTNGTELEETRSITATRGQTIQWYWWLNDSVGNSNQTDIWSFVVDNTLPTTPALILPEDDNVTTDRTPSFNWTDSTDADGDTINYTLNITCIGGCSDDNREYNVTDSNFTLTDKLQYFGDDGYHYEWNVRAWDGYNYSGYSTTRNFTVNTLVILTLVNGTVNFGTKNLGDRDNTTDNSPEPFLLQNDGNSFIDVNISSLDLLWDTKTTASDFFQYKADNYTGEEGSFNSTGSIVDWANVSTSAETFIDHFNHSDALDSAEADINIEVPLDEPPGNKSSTIVFTGWYVAT